MLVFTGKKKTLNLSRFHNSAISGLSSSFKIIMMMIITLLEIRFVRSSIRRREVRLGYHCILGKNRYTRDSANDLMSSEFDRPIDRDKGQIPG